MNFYFLNNVLPWKKELHDIHQWFVVGWRKTLLGSLMIRAVSNDHLQWNDCNDRNEMIHCHFIAPNRSLQWSLDFSVQAQSFHCHCHCKWWFHICSLHHCISLHTFSTDSLSFHWKLDGLTHTIISLHAYYAAICNEHITFIATSLFHSTFFLAIITVKYKLNRRFQHREPAACSAYTRHDVP